MNTRIRARLGFDGDTPHGYVEDVVRRHAAPGPEAGEDWSWTDGVDAVARLADRWWVLAVPRNAALPDRLREAFASRRIGELPGIDLIRLSDEQVDAFSAAGGDPDLEEDNDREFDISDFEIEEDASGDLREDYEASGDMEEDETAAALAGWQSQGMCALPLGIEAFDARPEGWAEEGTTDQDRTDPPRLPIKGVSAPIQRPVPSFPSRRLIGSSRRWLGRGMRVDVPIEHAETLRTWLARRRPDLEVVLR